MICTQIQASLTARFHFSLEALREFPTKAKPLGLSGFDATYHLFTDEETKRLCDIASEYGMKISGGSDFHGENKPDIKLGVGKENIKKHTQFIKN